MKITPVDFLVLDRQFPFVLVHTDEDLTGIGECFRRQPAVTKTVVAELLAPAIIGKDPVDTDSLPPIWDADFLYGPKTTHGEDPYVLCEINVQSVYPFPDEALDTLAQTAVARMVAAKKVRRR